MNNIQRYTIYGPAGLTIDVCGTAEKVQNFIATLEWEVCPANMRDVIGVTQWEALKMGPTKRKGAARALNKACRLAHVSLPTWAL